MSQFSEPLLTVFLFFTGVWSLILIHRKIIYSSRLTLLAISLSILVLKGLIPFVIFLGCFLPLMSMNNNVFLKSKLKQRNTSIREKLIVYITTMPLFGLILLKKESFLENIKNISINPDGLLAIEIIFIVVLIVTIASSYKVTRSS